MVAYHSRLQKFQLWMERKMSTLFSTLSELRRATLGPNQSPIQRVCRPSPGVKRLGRAVYHLCHSNAETKNKWSCTITPPILLHGVDSHLYLF
jgi:hypothetical protein